MVECEHCKKEIESKKDLLVMAQWGIIPRPLHKVCWGDLASSHAGVGSVSYGTGAFRKRNSFNIPVNSLFSSLVAVIFLAAAFFVLTFDFSGSAITENGVQRALTGTETMIVPIILFVVLLVPVLVRLWSYFLIESRI